MKKTVLTLASILFASAAAQAQWTLQPFTFTNSYLSAHYLDAVDTNVVWSAGFDLVNNTGGNQVARTSDGGTTWSLLTIANLGANEEITGIAGVNATTAVVCTSTGSGGRILKTVDSGVTWTVQTTTTQFGTSASFPNYIAFFNATEGVCAGDPITSTGRFEIYRTTDAGTTWTAVPTANIPVSTSGEFSVVNHFSNTTTGFWFSTTTGRVFGSIDKGLTWTVGSTGLTTSIPWVSFRDATNGIALAGTQLARTTNGGTTWQAATYTGPLHTFAIDNVPGTNQFISVGAGTDAGSSFSRDNGATWTAIESTRSHGYVDVVSPTLAWSSAVDPSDGSGRGVYKLASTVLSTQQNAALQQGLRVYPNPSTDGQFTVALAAGQGAEAQVQVFDALGRSVYTRTVPTAATPTFGIDLSQQATGIYTLQLRTAGGVAQQKLVVK